MNLNDADLLDLHALCSAVVDGVLTEAERARLETMLTQSETARREYVRIFALSASLHGYAAEMQADAPEEPRILKFTAEKKGWITAAVLAAAAVIVFGFWIQIGNKHNTESNSEVVITSDGNESIARLSGIKDCTWRGTAVQPGDVLSRDQVLEIISGLAEITFDSGARLVLEGPATLAVRSAWEAELLRGSLKAQVPHEAIGFRLVHSAVNVVDLGTEFTMTADENGEAEVLVLKGAVEATPSHAADVASPNFILNENQGRRFARSGVSELRLREQKLAKWSRKFQIERPVKALSLARWTFDDVKNNIFSAQLIGNMTPRLDMELFNATAAPSTEPLHDGRWQKGLQLDGRSFAKSALPQFSARYPRTVAFWIKIPADASPSEAAAALAWSSPDGTARTEFGWNTSPGQGPFGALRMSTPHGYVIGSTLLRDGQWHHVAVIINHPAHEPDHMQISFYLDGRLESLSAKHMMKRAVHDVLLKTGTLWIGRSASTQNSAGGFRGILDELVITDRALAPEEVRLLMRANQIGAAGAEMF